MVWNPADLPDAQGRTIAITGANAGVGYFTAEQLAGAGAHVILACRDQERAEAAVAAIRRRVRGARVEATPLDVADRASVDAAADALLERDRLDGLILNAGVVHAPRTRRSDRYGNELVLATNVLGHFRLVARVLPALERTAEAAAEPVIGPRIVSLGSLATRLGRLRLDDLQLERSYSSWRAYSGSKIALQAFGFELERRLRAAGSGVTSLVVHPGYSTSGRTPGIRGVNHPSRAKRFVDNLQAAWTQGKDHGAWAPVRAMLDPALTGDDYLGPLARTKGIPVQAHPTRASRSPRTGARLWPLLEAAAAQPFPLP
ncbi:SDR family NAD(P)-dependent oxidoreductase [Leifsonia sp. F6_8S_P_1B]|uniref:SDR family NAD(P)-dependent oxidoreductase n=1 Tax=Leifsonia williamsii TaxID=3035919 RepID=A0ABT8K6L1_9MICO|nr:SDR family NAD(P)-dependent oxidoreductase [Leifsonia williamsii]MDN4613039.1 SDR family NAD(P)-dependent oxidoreductase [Leifsonia williamsii]